jgi:hypothetical protein
MNHGNARCNSESDHVFLFNICENIVLQNPPIIYTHPVYVNIHNQYPQHFVNIRVILAYIYTRRMDNLEAY